MFGSVKLKLVSVLENLPSVAQVGIGICPVEPDFTDLTVLGQQFIELVREVTVVVINLICVIGETGRRRAAFGGITLEAGWIGRDDGKHIAAAVAVVTGGFFGLVRS